MSNAVAVKDTMDVVLPDFGEFPQFDAPPQAERRVVYWMNGSPKQRKAGGLSYFGGWCISAENLNPDILSQEWSLEEVTTEDGSKTFQVYTVPVIRVAMLGWRESWIERQRETGVQPVYRQHYGEGLTSYVEVAAIADSIKGAIVLTAKGMNANQLKKTYGKAVGDLNRAFKKPIPPYAFFLGLGGELVDDKTPKFTVYGKAPQQSSIIHITPRWTLDNAYLKTAQTPGTALDMAREFVAVHLPRWKVERFQQVVAAPAPTAPDDVTLEEAAF